jgi:transcriptional regulator with XRE-family HTH domain
MEAQAYRVAELREAQGLSREQLAVKAGISSRTVARLENREGPVHRGTLLLLARALDCDVDDLIDEAVAA